jgi:hypothetical protein
VVEAIPDTYITSQLDIDNADSYDTDLDDKWSHGCYGREIAARRRNSSYSIYSINNDNTSLKIGSAPAGPGPNKELSSRAVIYLN